MKQHLFLHSRPLISRRALLRLARGAFVIAAPGKCFAQATDRAPAKLSAAETGQVRQNRKDGADMVLIPAGAFVMGTTAEQATAWTKAHPQEKPTFDWFFSELPLRTVEMSAFYMYKNDVTVAQYRAFCMQTNRKMPPAPRWKWRETDPIVNVKWVDAKAYAGWAGVVLPTSAQWEKAARGADAAIYPWGNEWDVTRCNNSVGRKSSGTSPVGSFPQGASPYGCLDMAGNAAQWCSDEYSTKYLVGPGGAAPLAVEHVLRGGHWRNDLPWYFRAARINRNDSLGRQDIFGFRCAVPA